MPSLNPSPTQTLSSNPPNPKGGGSLWHGRSARQRAAAGGDARRRDARHRGAGALSQHGAERDGARAARRRRRHRGGAQRADAGPGRRRRGAARPRLRRRRGRAGQHAAAGPNGGRGGCGAGRVLPGPPRGRGGREGRGGGRCRGSWRWRRGRRRGRPHPRHGLLGPLRQGAAAQDDACGRVGRQGRGELRARRSGPAHSTAGAKHPHGNGLSLSSVIKFYL
mmetsp:Transcript_27381/g.86804  ORF Transcript_27381/g.86804 Transcript_27381/m.86804 type:complete len:222 (+) Transcript_27381:363-1028(+)